MATEERTNAGLFPSSRRSEATDHRGDFFAQVKTVEMAQKIARRLGKPHGVFSDFAVRWIEAIDALEQELRSTMADNQTTDAARKIADRLARAIATACIDDYSKARTLERFRHVERIGAMNEARRFLLGDDTDEE